MTDPVRPVAPRESIEDWVVREARLIAGSRTHLQDSEALIQFGLRVAAYSLAAAPVPCAASPVDQWQPIETAPQDWSWFLAWSADLEFLVYRSGPCLIAAEEPDPTHWMPLPTPPRATGEGARDGHQQTIETPPPTTGEVWGKTTASADSWAIGIGSSQAATVAPRSDPSAEAAPVAVSLDPHRLLR